MTFASSKPSRRERPAKPALTREGIIGAALDILKTEGLDKVTMRRVATALDTGPASLYVYVKNTEDLHAQLLDALLESPSDNAPQPGNWQDQLIALLSAYAHVLFAHAGIARITMFTRAGGPNYLRLAQRILGLLSEGGIADRDAAWALDLLLQFATATAAEKSEWRNSPTNADETASLTRAIRDAPSKTHPNIVHVRDEIFTGGNSRFEWGLRVLIAGIVAAPRVAPQ